MNFETYFRFSLRLIKIESLFPRISNHALRISLYSIIHPDKLSQYVNLKTCNITFKKCNVNKTTKKSLPFFFFLISQLGKFKTLKSLYCRKIPFSHLKKTYSQAIRVQIFCKLKTYSVAKPVKKSFR